MQRILRTTVLALATCWLGCGHGSPSPSPSTPTEPRTEPTARHDAADTHAEPAKPDRCDAWIQHEVAGMSWYVGEYGLLDYVDVDRLPAVVRTECHKLSDEELACVSKDTPDGDKLHCVSSAERDAYRSALLPLLALPADLRAAAKAATRCEYGKAMTAMNACPKVPERYRRNLERAWSSAANVQSPPFACQVGVEVMKRRLASIGC
jgi:hypothetical protein